MSRATGAFTIWILVAAACGSSSHQSVDATTADGARSDASVDAPTDTPIDAPSKAWAQRAYIKASTRAAGGFAATMFGVSVALSADGSTLAVGAYLENSGATGIDGNQADTSASASGAVYVFIRAGTTWSQQAYVKASNARLGAEFGFSVALSADGNTLAVGALNESSAATGIDGNQADTSMRVAGAVYVFSRASTTWSQQAYVKASNTRPDAHFGNVVALSADGNTLAVGAGGESSAATGINGNQTDTSALCAGAAYVFTRAATTWSQQAYVKASNAHMGANFGGLGCGGYFDRAEVALSADGNTLAVGADQDAMAGSSGVAYVFARAGATWSEQAMLKAANAGGLFGISVTLSADGSTLAVGANTESSAATGIDGNQADTSANAAGAAYVFTRVGTTWSQQAYVKASNTRAGAGFGLAVALSADGNMLAVSGPAESSAATGVDGNQASTSAAGAGAVYLFARTGTTWSQRSYVKASNTRGAALFGIGVALSADTSTLAVGSYYESSAATGIDGNQADTSTPYAGAAYVFAAQ